MKAVVFDLRSRKLSLQQRPRPVCGDRDVIIQVKAVGICGGDLPLYHGRFDVPMDRKDFIPGHEFTGVVAEVGSQVTAWRVGNRVVTDNTGGACGVCPSCAQGHFVNCLHRQVIGLTMDGGFADYVRVPGDILALHPNCMFHLPDNVDFAAGTVLEPAANAYRAVFQEGGMKPGDHVVVYGPGPVGLLCVQMARIGGAGKIYLVGQSVSRGCRKDIGIRYGADAWLENDAGQDIEAQIKQEVGEHGVDLILDTVGHPSILPEAMSLVRSEGTIVRVGMSDKPLNASLNPLTLKAIRLLGHMGYDTECWRACLRLAQRGTLDLSTVVTHHLPLEQFLDGMRMSVDNTAAKVVLLP